MISYTAAPTEPHELEDDDLCTLWGQVGRNLSMARVDQLNQGKVAADGPCERRYVEVRREMLHRKLLTT